MKLTLIGAGKMGSAIAGGLVRNRVFKADELAAADPSPAARASFETLTKVRCFATAEAALSGTDAVLLAVKPQNAATIAADIAPFCREKLFISIMAGVPIRRLGEWFGTDRVVRVMPNTPLLVGEGASVFACGAGVKAADRELAKRIFGALGIVFEMKENLLDAVTALSGSGPAYVFEFVQALVDAAVTAGLSPEPALALTVQTVAGAAEMLRSRIGSPEELRDAVTSPGGTTAAGLAVLADGNFRGLIRKMILAARDRSVELGRNA
ncbi:MAG: pyrroline-5-carboxylate reductase [Kiritimatiellaeota bacterium]|nr:pyrroline-5-carboxylate reductase [Kiritimatiellota bacterium]